MMMSCPIQAPGSLFCAPGSGADMDEGGGATQPVPLSNPHPLFPTASGRAGGGGGQHQTPGAWFFQQAPDGFEAFPGNGSLISDAVAPSLSPLPGSLAHQQLLARFGPRHTTESVEVPSSEHVAEIVGRQGCKIKALRAKTNTYIKTPVRGEEPVFVVTGRHEDVVEAKREIECAAEHFTQIRASRRHSQGGCPAPGHVTAYVRVPLRVVGLVVGPKGNTIKRIQQDTHTYIITPSRDREPIFEVTGLPQNVEAARREIEQHIYQRTGNMPITDPSASIVNYDLHAAALQAQQAALQANAGNRPNYGALAVSSASARHPSPYQPYLQHFRQHGLSAQSAFGTFCASFGSAPDGSFRPSHHPQHFVGGGAPKVCGGSERGTASPPPSQADQGNRAIASLGTSASANNLHALLSALELEGQAGSRPRGAVGDHSQHNQPPACSASSKPAAGSALLFRSSSSGGAPSESRFAASAGPASAFSPWVAPSHLPSGAPADFLDLLSSNSPSPLFSASSGGSLGCVGSGGLSSVNSTSRDEGLGDSPTNSFGRPHGTDPYQHLMTIWADVCESGAVGKLPKEVGKETK